MTSPRDEIDDWLGGDVEPLYPQPGTLDRIRNRARRRKTRQAVIAAAGCAVVLGAAVSVPQLVGSGHRAGGPNPPAAAGSTPSSVQSGTGQPASSSASPATNSSAPPPPNHSFLSTTTSGFGVPAHFRPTSVTFVGVGGGNVVGAVIGQAGPPCATNDCTSLAGTSDYGGTWYGVSAPTAPGPAGGAGVSQLRFADLRNGWAFGPALYETSGGGWPWYQESTGGQRVIDVEAAAGGPALGLFGTCTGTGSAYAADCTSFSLNTSAAGSRTWTPISMPPGTMTTGHAASAALVVTGRTGYLLTPTGAVLTGPVSGGAWRRVSQAPCSPGPAQPSGLPSQALLATTPQQLMVACAVGSTGGPSATGPVGQTRLYTSINGSNWHLAGAVTHASNATSLTSGTAGQVVLATTAGIYQSADGGKTWHQSRLGSAGPAGGFSYVGMTNPSDGVAVPTDVSLGVIYVSTDGGLRWRSRPIVG